MRIGQFKPEELNGVVKLLVNDYGDIDEDYQLFTDVFKIDYNSYKVSFNYVYEYESIGDRADSYTTRWTNKHFIVDSKDDLSVLKSDINNTLYSIINTPIAQL